MKSRTILHLAIAIAAAVAVAACGSGGSTGTTGAGTTGAVHGSASSSGAGGGNPSGKTCDDFLMGDPVMAVWSTKLTSGDFDSTTSADAYSGLNTCACVHKLADMGCEDACKSGDNGMTKPDFCDGAAAGAGCATCLHNACSSSLLACKNN